MISAASRVPAAASLGAGQRGFSRANSLLFVRRALSGSKQDPNMSDDPKDQAARNVSKPGAFTNAAETISRSKRSRQTMTSPAVAESSTFVSRHFTLPHGEVEAYIERHRMRFKRSSTHVIVEECPFCHSTRGLANNQYKLYVDVVSGVYFCHRCGAKGSWFALRSRVSGGSPVLANPFSKPVHSERVAASALDDGQKRRRGRPRTRQPDVVNEHHEHGRLISSEDVPPRVPAKGMWLTVKSHLTSRFPKVLEHLNASRKIETRVLTHYGVGVDYFAFYKDDRTRANLVSYVFPMFNDKKELVRFKIRAVEEKMHMRLDPKGGAWGLFGLNVVPDDAQEIVLTEGEFDAMAVYQATGVPAVSLPNGARSLPVSLLPALERFRKIYLWMDDDVPGMEGAQQFARKLGIQRCYIVRCSRPGVACKDANEALQQGLDLRQLLGKASIMPHDGIATFNDLRSEIYMEITNPLQVQGIQSEFLPRLNSLICGHRRGELSIYSGHTGVGKTTFLSQMSLDYCMQGVPTLWGSFELSNIRIAKLLLSQFYARSTGKSPVHLANEFDEWAEKFENLPMFFMRYFGSNPIERVLDAMEYGNYVHDCSHVVLDNLQFMTSGQARGYDKFDVMDHAVEKLRRFATQHNAHVSLVVHPRKENDDQIIQTASIFGTAKATQEADNLIILQRTKDGPVVDVRKNRFDGRIGTLNLRFSESSRLFEERDTVRRNTRTLAALLQPAQRPVCQISAESKPIFSSGIRRKGSQGDTTV